MHDGGLLFLVGKINGLQPECLLKYGRKLICPFVLYRRQEHDVSHSGCDSETSEDLVLGNEVGCWLRSRSRCIAGGRTESEPNPVRGTRGKSECVRPHPANQKVERRREINTQQK